MVGFLLNKIITKIIMRYASKLFFVFYFLFLGFRLQNAKCMVIVDLWKNLNHSNIVQLQEVFTTKAFGDNCESD